MNLQRTTRRFGIVLNNWISFEEYERLYTFYHEQLHFFPADLHKFDNLSNLAINCWAAKWKKTSRFYNKPMSLKSKISNFLAILSLISGTCLSNSSLNRKMEFLIKTVLYRQISQIRIKHDHKARYKPRKESWIHQRIILQIFWLAPRQTEKTIWIGKSILWLKN